MKHLHIFYSKNKTEDTSILKVAKIKERKRKNKSCFMATEITRMRMCLRSGFFVADSSE